jgi:hypothetical protein
VAFYVIGRNHNTMKVVCTDADGRLRVRDDSDDVLPIGGIATDAMKRGAWPTPELAAVVMAAAGIKFSLVDVKIVAAE